MNVIRNICFIKNIVIITLNVDCFDRTYNIKGGMGFINYEVYLFYNLDD